MHYWWIIALLIPIFFCFSNALEAFQYSNLTNASHEVLFYQTTTASLKLIQFDIHDARYKSKQRIYYTSTRNLLTLSPEARFYTLGTIYSSFRFLDLNIANDTKESICNSLIPPAKKIEWLFNQLSFSYSIYGTNYLPSEDISICIITLSNLKARHRVSNFYPKNLLMCGSIANGNRLVIDNSSTLIETKELVQATCILFLTLILIGWLQSSCQQFVNERRRIPFQHAYLANDIS